MGEILSAGIVGAGLAAAESIYLSDVNTARVEELVARYGMASKPSNVEAVRASELVLVSVKPQDIAGVLEEIGPALGPRHLILSIAAGISTRFIEERVAQVPVVRAMPNAAAAVGAGITAICAGSRASEGHLGVAERLLEGVGSVVRVREAYIDAVTAISGSGPAYVALFAEAMVDAGVTAGLSRPLASELVVGTLAGAAAMMAEGGMSPAAVREAVTSPAGTTAMALVELERGGVRAAVLNAVLAAAERAGALSGEGRKKP